MSDIKIIKPGKTGFGVLIEQDAGYISPNDERNKAFIVEAKKLGEGQPVVGAPYIVYVVLQKHSVKNRNGRIYPKHILERENNNYQELIQQRRAIGELDHPESSIIAGDRISHNIIETWWEGKTLMGKMEILMSPGYMNYGIVSTKGDEVANLLRNNIMIGVSSRGVGSLREINGDNIVQEDFEIICWDVVTSPSTPGSWMFDQPQQAKQYTESKEITKNLMVDNINKFLLD
tara:strand:- start:644 stop:1339 length:696 start_codon:yes stop_codon:yes gene_type:complete